jgi:hypothetical protein
VLLWAFMCGSCKALVTAGLIVATLFVFLPPALAEPDGIFSGELAGRQMTLKAALCIHAREVVEGFLFDDSSKSMAVVGVSRKAMASGS